VALEQQLQGLQATAGLSVVTDGDAAPVVVLDPNINMTAKRLGEIVSRLDLFEMNGELVWFDDRGEMKGMTGRIFRGWINEYVVIAAAYDKKSGTAVPTTMKAEDAGTILELPNFRRGVRRLRTVNRVRLPWLCAEHGLIKLPWGYHAPTESYAVPGGLDYETDVAVESAKMWFERYLGTMPFHDARSYSVQMGAMLALYVKHLPGGGSLRPGFLWMANKQGSGKSVLAKVALYPVMGRAAAAKFKKHEELDKELEAFCRASVPYIFLDNVYGGIESASIDQLLTSEESTGRAMGGHGVFMVKNSPVLFVSANMPELNDDARRRFLIVDLHEKGDPNARKFEHALTDTVMKSDRWRSEALAALWALVANWHEAGKPAGTEKLGSFEEFAELLGGIVAAAGYGQCFAPAEALKVLSPEKAEFAELMAAVLGEMGEELEKDFTVEELARMARASKLFTDKVGTEADGKRLTIKEEGLGKEERAFAEDRGYMNPQQRSAWGKRLKKEEHTEHEVAGRKLEFGKRGQGRKSAYTVRVVG
jgi:hypothetical protein